jgi:hypothetical protein
MHAHAHPQRALKKGVTGFKVVKYSVKWAKEAQSTYVQKPMLADIWAMFI